MFRYMGAAVIAAIGTTAAFAGDASVRLGEAATVFSEIMEAPDRSIPADLLRNAHCTVIIPGVKKAAFIVGGAYGRGFAICRNERGRGWGAPSAVRMEGGSFGFQVGASETDIVMLVMNRRGMEKLLQSKFTLGGDAEVAAGPVGRSSTARTDAKMTAKILSWSRSRGVFAGISLAGATLRNDLDENRELYGRRWSSKQVLLGKVRAPQSAKPLIAALDRYSPRERGDD